MPHAKDPSSDDSFKKLEDELRNVLSGLNKSEPLAPVPLMDDIHEEEIVRPPEAIIPPTDLESEKLGEEAFRQASKPMTPDPVPSSPLNDAPASLPPSDADFWKGNVLGWPADEPAPQLPPAKIEEPKSQVFPETPIENPWLEEKPSDLPQIFKPSEKTEKKPPVRLKAHQEDPLYIDDFPVPSPPTPPQFNEELPEIEIEPFPASQGQDLPSPPPRPPVGEPLDAPKEALASGILDKLHVPIPGTLHQVPEPTKKPKIDSVLEEMSIKPTDRIQVACLFPDGQEQAANDFVQKLKMAAAKAVGVPEIEIVLSTPWFIAEIKIPTWKKAASLSGAHFLFVLANKKDKDLFKDLSKLGHKDEVRARLVYTEQVGLRTLYADLLPDLMRVFNGQD